MGNSPVQQPVAEHYVSEFYLKGFTQRGVLWVYEKFKPIRSSTPKLEGHRPDFYTHSEQGVRDDSAEADLGQMESVVAPIIRKLANPQYQITNDQALSLVIFAAFMFVRVPSWREHSNNVFNANERRRKIELAQNKSEFYKWWADVWPKGTPFWGMGPEDVRQSFLRGEWGNNQISKAFINAEMFNSGRSIMNELLKFHLQLLHAPEGKFFVTSDCPVYTIQPDGKDLATIGMVFQCADVEVFFPLNKRVCLRLKKALRYYRGYTTERNLENVNKLIMAASSQFLYSSENSERLQRLFNENGCRVRAGINAFMPVAS